MNKKQLFYNLLYVISGIIFAVGLSYVHAATFTNGANPPANNTATPLNVGINDQIKTGGLAVDSFVANANAELDGSTYFGGALEPDPGNANAMINFGGTDPAGVVRAVNMAITGGFSNTGSITSSLLANNSMSPVCADANGDVILCNATTVCSNIPGATTVPAGDVRNANGTCSIATLRFYSVLSQNKSVQNFGGGVVNSNLPASSTATLPPVATLGLDDDDPYGWRVDDIAGIQGTGLTSTDTRLLTVPANAQPGGSYNITLNLQGQLGIQGKFPSDNNYIFANFYLKINSQIIPMASAGNLVLYNPSGSIASSNQASTYQFAGSFLSNPSGSAVTVGGNGDTYKYTPYTVNFNKVVTLNPGDTVDVYVDMYGASTRTSGFTTAFVGDWNNFYYSMEMNQGSSFNIVETP